MSHGTKLMLDDDILQELQKYPRSERSLLVNRALRAYLQQQRRHRTAQAMDEIRGHTAPLSGSAEQWVREDREGKRSN